MPVVDTVREQETFALCPASHSPSCPLGLGIAECQTLRTRLTGLVRLRWAVIGAAGPVLTAGAFAFPGAAPWLALAGLLAGLALTNAAWQWRVSHRVLRRCHGAIEFAGWQITVDFVLLAALLYLTGGSESPLAPLFLLHGVFAAILLPRRTALAIVALGGTLIVVASAAKLWGPVAPDWEFGPGGGTPAWARQALRLGALGLALAGSTLQGLALSRELRMRHRRIAELARTLEARNEELRRLDQQRLLLLAAASHDLRSPLASVESMLDLFLFDQLPGCTEQHKGYLRRIKERLQLLRGFITDLLRLTEIEVAGGSAAQGERVDLLAQLRDAVAEQRPVAGAAGIELVVSLPEDESRFPVLAPPSRLRMVWSNLLGNAIKYSVGRSPVQLTLRRSSEQAEVIVADRGLGMSEEDRAHLFEDFFRAPTVKKAGIPGTGLGLSISRRVIEAAGGHIAVASRLEEGTTFTVTLPLLPEESPDT